MRFSLLYQSPFQVPVSANPKIKPTSGYPNHQVGIAIQSSTPPGVSRASKKSPASCSPQQRRLPRHRSATRSISSRSRRTGHSVARSFSLSIARTCFYIEDSDLKSTAAVQSQVAKMSGLSDSQATQAARTRSKSSFTTRSRLVGSSVRHPFIAHPRPATSSSSSPSKPNNLGGVSTGDACSQTAASRKHQFQRIDAAKGGSFVGRRIGGLRCANLPYTLLHPAA